MAKTHSRIVCKGCQRAFTFSGYARHLARPKNPRCQRLAKQPEPSSEPASGDEEPTRDSTPHPPSPQMDSVPLNQFLGDYFGDDYEENDFEWEEEENNAEEDEESTQFSHTNIDEDSNDEYEPPLQDNTSGSSSSSPIEEDMPGVSQDGRASERSQTEEQLRQRAVIDRYPGSAGTPLSNLDMGSSGY